MGFPPKLGCPMCSIVTTASNTAPGSPGSPSFPPGSTQPEVLWRDDNFTAYREKANPVSSAGHIIVAFKCAHTLPFFLYPNTSQTLVCTYPPSIPSYVILLCHWICSRNGPQSSSDLPLLVTVKTLATRLLAGLLADSPSSATATTSTPNPQFRIGFITPPFKDSKIPVTDHLHAHAYIAPANLMGWWRSVGYSPMAWYAIDDLIAEIRYVVLSMSSFLVYSTNRQRICL